MLSQLQTFTNYVRKNDLIGFSEVILLAVSGGKDSVAMTHLFHQAGFKIAIAHCNFNLRGEESVRDAEFVKYLSESLNVPFHPVDFDTSDYADKHKISIQMAARKLRYDFFEEIRQQFRYSKIAVAQHQNDAIETVILNLIRGTGIAGLHGIKTVRDHIIRPLMCFTRDDIENIINEGNFTFVEDSSNASAKYARNKIRLKIIPEMKAINPSLEETFQKNIAYFSELEQFLRTEIDKYKSKLFCSADDGSLKIKITDIRNLASPKFVLSEILMSYGFNLTSVNDILKGCYQQQSSGKVFFSDDYQIILNREELILERKNTANDQQETALIRQEDLEVKLSGFLLYQKTDTIVEKNSLKDKNLCHTDAEKLVYPLLLRKWEFGDKFIPMGMQGFKKISDFLINQKVPLHKKEEIFLLINGDGAVIWVCGYRTDNRFKITDDTKKITTFGLKK